MVHAALPILALRSESVTMGEGTTGLAHPPYPVAVLALRSRGRAATLRLLLLLLASALAGLLVAGLLLPIPAGLGLVTRAGAESFAKLPLALETPPLPQNSRVLASDGSLLATFYEQNRIYARLSAIAPSMRQAIIAIEDSRFYEHGGVDVRGTVRALVNNSAGETVQGGSTITQQYVKNVLVESAVARDDAEAVKAATERSYARKLRELRYAVALEQRLSKAEILERYLNIAYFGNGAYGIEAAARRYFSKPAKSLTAQEAALLAGLVKNPASYDPVRKPKQAQGRRNVVLTRMQELGMMSTKRVRHLSRAKLVLKPTLPRSGCDTSYAGFFCDYVKRVVLRDPVFGRSAEDRQRLLFRGGVTIRTTLDPRAQRAAQRALARYVEPTNRVAGTVVMVEPGTGRITGMAVSRGFGSGKGKMQNNIAVDQEYGGSAGISPGSTFKTFLATEALRQGYGFRYRIMAPSRLRSVPPVSTCEGRAYDPGYSPRNETTSENGVYDLSSGISKSINTYFVQLQSRVGLCEVATLVERIGVRPAGDPTAALQQIQAWTLGPQAVSPLAMSAAYAMYAARGTYCSPVAILEMRDRSGRSLRVPQSRCEQVIEPELADAVTHLLRGVVSGGTGRNANIGRPQAGKTGTHERTTAWFIGYTPQLAAAVAVYNPTAPAAYRLENVRIGGRFFGQVQGANLPAPIWRLAISGALAGEPERGFVAAESRYFTGTTGPGVRPRPRPTPRDDDPRPGRPGITPTPAPDPDPRPRPKPENPRPRPPKGPKPPEGPKPPKPKPSKNPKPGPDAETTPSAAGSPA